MRGAPQIHFIKSGSPEETTLRKPQEELNDLRRRFLGELNIMGVDTRLTGRKPLASLFENMALEGSGVSSHQDHKEATRATTANVDKSVQDLISILEAMLQEAKEMK